MKYCLDNQKIFYAAMIQTSEVMPASVPFCACSTETSGLSIGEYELFHY